MTGVSKTRHDCGENVNYVIRIKPGLGQHQPPFFRLTAMRVFIVVVVSASAVLGSVTLKPASNFDALYNDFLVENGKYYARYAAIYSFH